MQKQRVEWGQVLFILFVFFCIGSTIWNWDVIQAKKTAKREAAFNEKLLVGKICPEDEELRYFVDVACSIKMEEYLRKRRKYK